VSVNDRNPDPQPHGLSASDAEALDALLDADYDLARVPEALRDRAERVARLLGLLDTPITGADETLVRRTFELLCMRHTRSSNTPVLCNADEDALEAWMMSRGDLSRVPAAVRERAGVHESIRHLLTHTQPASTGVDLVEATLARVQQAVDAQDDRLRISSHRSLRLSDIISVAAVMLLAASILLPVLSSVRSEARKALCQSNLTRVAEALGIYAGANDSSLPMATAGFGGRPWIDVGSSPERSNSANLYVLVRNHFSPLSDLACPGNPSAPTSALPPDAMDWRHLREVSYSYQVQDGRARRMWHLDPSLPIIADRSPVILQIVLRDPIVPEARSPNHSSRGQHIIRADASVDWIQSPVTQSGDNIWLPRPIEQAVAKIRRFHGMNGNEVPAGVDDVLLGP